MMKLIAIGALLCATALPGDCVDGEKATLTRQVAITMPRSTSVPMGDQLYTVSMGKSSLHVNSSDANSKPCDMAIDPAKDSIEDEVNVVASHDMIYVWGKHGVEKVDGQDRNKFVLLMINPRDCSLKSANVPATTSYSTPSLVVRKAGVDLFFREMITCAPCRFSNDGARVNPDALPQIPPAARSADGFPYSSRVARIGSNYLYSQNQERDKATLKIVDGERMSVLKERQVDYPVDELTSTKAGLMGVCSKKYDRMMADIVAFKEINCVRMNAELESRVPIKITMKPYSRPVSRVSYDIDESTGNSYTGFAEDQNLAVFVHDDKGKLVKAYDMGKIDERFEKYQHQPMFYMPYAHWDVRGYILGDEYCLVTEQTTDMDKHEVDLHEIRCISLVK